MLGAFLGIDFLVMFAVVGFVLILVWAMFFIGCLVYGIYAEENRLPMPFDDRYKTGKVNQRIYFILAITAFILILI